MATEQITQTQVDLIIVTAIITTGIGLCANILFEWYKRQNLKTITRKHIATSLIADLKVKKDLINSRLDDFKNFETDNLENYSFVYFPVRSNYFSVFKSITNKLGYINDENLKKNIITTYTEIKGLFDSVQALEDISKQAQQLLKTPDNEKYLLLLATNHRFYANKILTQMLPNVIGKMNALENDLKKYLENL